MSKYIGSVIIYPSVTPPDEGWMLCDGTEIDISENQELYNIIGDLYGSAEAGKFKLPDFTGKVLVGTGEGVGLTSRALGDEGGAQEVTLSEDQIPIHNHSLNGSQVVGTETDVSNSVMLASPSTFIETYEENTSPVSPLQSDILGESGSGQAHNNIMNSITVNFFIAVK